MKADHPTGNRSPLRKLMPALPFLLAPCLVVGWLTLMDHGVAGAVPNIVAQKVDVLLVDNDADNVADPGDTIRYVTVVTNTGVTNAGDVLFDDTVDANTTFVAGSLRTTPIARHDSYASTGNVGITVPAGSGVLANDNDPDGTGGVTVFSFDSSSANGGNVSVAGDGSFSYDPPPGFEGTDQFSYVIQDGDGNQDPATVFIVVTDVIWFVDSSRVAQGDGRLNSPFNSLDGAGGYNASAADDPGDVIFLYSGGGTYTGGIALQNGQLLIGQGASQSIATISGITQPPFSNALPATGGGKPTIENSGGDGISLAANNRVQGLLAGDAIGSSIAGSSVDTATILETIIDNRTGGGIEVFSGTLAVDLESLTSSSSGDEGIDLTNVAGSFAVPAGSIINSGSRAVNIDGAPSLALSVALTSVSSSSTANGILVRDITGSFTISGTGSTDGSGGVISSITSRGASFINATNISLSNMTFSNASTANGASNCTSLVNSGCNAAIHLESSVNVDLTNVDISTTAQQGINGLNVTNFDLLNSTITACGNEVNEGCLRMRNLSGTAVISDSNLSFAAERVAQIENTSQTLNLTVSNSTFRDTQASGFGADGLEVTHDGSSNATIDIVNSSFLRNRTNGLQVFSEGTSFVSLDVTGSTFDSEAGIGIGMDLAADNSATLHFNVIGNPVIHSRSGSAVNVFADISASVQGRINANNDIEVQSGLGSGIAVQNNQNANTVLEIDGNTIQSGPNDFGITLRSRLKTSGGGGRLDATVNNNTISVQATALYDIELLTLDTNELCGNVTNNNASGGGLAAFRVRESAGTILLQGFNTDAATTWANNGNSPTTAGSVSESPAGSASGGTCNTVSHPTAALDSGTSLVKGPSGPTLAQRIDGALRSLAGRVEALREAWTSVNLAAAFDRVGDSAQDLADRLVAAMGVSPAHASGETVNVALGDLNPGQQVAIIFDVTVDATIPANVTQVCNQGLVTSNNHADVLPDDPAVGGGTDPTCTLVPQADLSIEKSDSADPVSPNAAFSYTVTVVNNGPSIGQSVVVTDTLPAGVTYISNDCGAGSPVSQVLTWTIGTLAYPGSAVCNINVTAPGSAGTITNNASASTTTHDPFSVNNSISEDTEVLTPVDLAISKDDGQTTAVPGESITYTIVVSNNGPNNATGATVGDTFPAALTGVTWTCSASVGSSCTAAGAGDINDTVNVLNGGSLTYSVSATIDPSAHGTLANTATVDPPAGFGDTNTSDNSDTDTDTLTPEANLSVSKSDDSDPVTTGDNVIYTITVNNAGPSDAQNVVASDTLPGSVTFVATSGCAEDPGGAPTCTLGSIPAGGFAQYTIEVTTNSDGLITNNVSVSSSASDPDGGDNSASEDTTVQLPGTILVQKAVSQGDPGNPNQTFTLDIRQGSVILGGLSTIKAGDPPVGLGGLLPGITYTVNEINLAPGWTLDDITCVNNVGNSTFGTFTPGDNSLEVTLAAGSTVLCTFTNVFNSPPVANNDNYSTDEDTTLNESTTGVLGNGVLVNDTDADGDSLTAVKDSDPSHGTLTLNSDGSFSYSPDLNFCGSDSFAYHANDGQADSNTATVDITVNCVDDPPSVSVDVTSQTVQYSDSIADVTVTATDIDSHPLSISDDAPSNLSTSGSCTPDGGGTSCSWTLSGQVLVAAGTYDVTFTVSDATNDVGAETQIEVEAEDATVAFDPDNPVGVQVDSPGGESGAFSLTVYVTETEPDQPADKADFGDLNNISDSDLSMTLVPVGPGGAESGTCSKVGVTGTGYDAVLEVLCTFDSVPVNTYTAQFTVEGGYYTGRGEDVLTVYDPSLGFTTGGGWFYWPGTQDKTNFGYTMKYNKKGQNLKGSLLLIRHTDDDQIYRVKSNALHGLAIGEDGSYGWASFGGKATYKELSADPIGNHEFIVYVEDHGEPGRGADRFWIELRDKDGVVVWAVSLPSPAPTNAATLEGGNIFVPHTTGPGKK